MNRCVCLIRQDLHYRRRSFEQGLRAAGFEIGSIPPVPVIGDLLVTWNRYGINHEIAKRFEQTGAAVIVVENGYLGATYDAEDKPLAPNGEPLLAMALWHHVGAGDWYVGGPGRWHEQGIRVQPWRRAGGHVLVLPQRGIGPPGVAMPPEWPSRTVQKLGRLTNRTIKLRRHPGNQPAATPLEADLGNAWCAVAWGSSAALKALIAGVPVFSDFPKWIGASATRPLDDADIEQPLANDLARIRMLDRLAWSQWTVKEIATGEPFRRLMALYQEPHRLG